MIELKVAQSLSREFVEKCREELAKECDMQVGQLVGVQTTIYFAVCKADQKMIGYRKMRMYLEAGRKK